MSQPNNEEENLQYVLLFYISFNCPFYRVLNQPVVEHNGERNGGEDGQNTTMSEGVEQESHFNGCSEDPLIHETDIHVVPQVAYAIVMLL